MKRDPLLRPRGRVLLQISLLALFLAFAGWGSNAFGQATVMTDYPDYAPADFVTITGAGWIGGETVTLKIEHMVFTDHPVEIWTTVAREDGSIYDMSYMIDPWDLGESFLLTASATNPERVVTTTFTDGDKVGLITIEPIEFSTGLITYKITVNREPHEVNGSHGTIHVSLCVKFSEEINVAATFNGNGNSLTKMQFGLSSYRTR